MAAGSSSGSAAAVAAREMPLAIGTDTGGSIRVPTAFCGITSMKPTYGRVPRHGVMPISWTLDHVGPMARTVADVAFTMEIIAGHDQRDPSALRDPVPRYRDSLERGVEGMRIGVPRNWFFDYCDPQVEQATRSAISTLEQAGASIVEIDLPELDTIDPVSVEWLIVNSECASLHEANSSRIDLYTTEFASHILDGRMVLAIDYLRAHRLRTILQRGPPDTLAVWPCHADPLKTRKRAGRYRRRGPVPSPWPALRSAFNVLWVVFRPSMRARARIAWRPLSGRNSSTIRMNPASGQSTEPHAGCPRAVPTSAKCGRRSARAAS